MIRHNVVFQIKAATPKETIDNAFQLLFDLKKKLPGFIRVAGGKCKFHEGHGAIDNLYGFSIDFENEDAYSLFLNDSTADPVKKAIIDMTVNGYDGIFGFDIGRNLEVFPNPLERYRTPVPRLLPPGASKWR